MSRDLESTQKITISRRNLLRRAGLLAGGGALVVQGADAAPVDDEPFINFQAMWTHGTSVQVERPEAVESVRRFAFHTRIVGRPGTSNWFHFAIPTPVVASFVGRREGGALTPQPLIMEYRRYKLQQVLVSLRTGSVDASVTNIHVHDGDKRVAAFDNLDLYGERYQTGYELPNAPEILEGICLSIGMRFRQNLRWVEFRSAGADFFHNYYRP